LWVRYVSGIPPAVWLYGRSSWLDWLISMASQIALLVLQSSLANQLLEKP
jgi:hypothetical protein